MSGHTATAAEGEEVVDDETSQWYWAEVRERPLAITLEVMGESVERPLAPGRLVARPDPAGTAFVVTARPLTK